MVNKKQLQIQTILLNKDRYRNRFVVQRKVNSMGLNCDNKKQVKVDLSKNYWRVRQRNACRFNKNTFRTKQLKGGIKLVVGFLK